MIYFDHAATTPCSSSVVEAMKPFFSEKYGNPSSIYKIGREAREVIFNSRKKVAELIGAKNPTEIIFTSGATESNNLVLKGVFFYATQVLNIKPHILVSSIEHHCVLDSAKYLKKYFGCEVDFIPVNKEGIIDLNFVKQNIKSNTVLVSVMAGNNEMGALEPIAELGEIILEARKDRLTEKNSNPLYFHTDAVQTYQYCDLRVDDLGVDLLSLTGHKFYGPKGVGLLYVRQGTKFLPQQQGGAQEKNLRAGTENVPYIVGLSEAMMEANNNRQAHSVKVSKVRDYLVKSVLTAIPEVELVGPENEEQRLPHIATFIFSKIEGESILINLDINNVAASSGSACTSGSLEPSHVTKAMGYGDMEAHGMVRFSLGKDNTKEEVDELMRFLPGVIEKLRAMSPIK